MPPNMLLPWSSSLGLVLWLLFVSSSPPMTTEAAGSSSPPSVPILARLGKDPATSLYTITIKHGGQPLVVDLSGPLLWSKCPPVHRTIPCRHSVCQFLNHNLPANNCGGQTTNNPSSCRNVVCTTHPSNPVTGECARADATTVTLSAYATNGANPLFPVTFMAAGSCAPEELFASSLPAGTAWGVAGLSRLPQSLPTQVASMFRVARQFALCFPMGTGGTGAAVFGGGPFQLKAWTGMGSRPVDLADGLRERQNQIPLLKNPENGGYYFRVTGISVNSKPVALPPGALDLHPGSGTGGVMLSTVTPYTALRSDVYRALLQAFDAATGDLARAPAVRPFEMCYQASKLGLNRLRYFVPGIDLLLENGRPWYIPGAGSMVNVNYETVCLAFIEMAPAVPGSPAILFGGFQLEDHLLLFDLDKETFAFRGPLSGQGNLRTGCNNFNFTS